MRILVAVPIFNEERYVARVLREIRKYSRAAALSSGIDMRVLVVDDGSTDDTPQVLRELARNGHIALITHPENRGYGQSLIDAFAFAADPASRGDDAQPYDWVITLDCDEQHEPCRIPLFVRECLTNDTDIISGSRYLALQSDGHPPADRRNINRLITDRLNTTLSLNVLDDGGKITDAFCGFKAHRVAAMQRMNLTIPGYAFPMQFWAQANALRLRIREIPVRLIYKDATRHFGGLLDDPAVRLAHYLEVLDGEIDATTQTSASGAAQECCSLLE